MALMEISELRNYKLKLEELYQSTQDIFTDLTLAHEAINNNISGSTGLAEADTRLANVLERNQNLIINSITKCNEFLDRQLSQTTVNIEQANQDMTTFISKVSSIYNVDITVPSLGGEISYFKLNSTSGAQVDSISSKTDTLSNFSEYFDNILSQIKSAWGSQNQDILSVCEELEKAMAELDTTIIPLLKEYAIVFKNLIESQQAIASQTIN